MKPKRWFHLGFRKHLNSRIIFENHQKQKIWKMENQNNEHEPRQEHHEHTHRKKKIKSPWMISTIVLGVVTVILLVLSFSGGFSEKVTGKVISSEEAGEKIMEFANAQGADAELVEVNDDGSFYEVILLMQGQEVPLYVTKDGKSFAQALIPLSRDTPANNDANQQSPSQNQPPADVPKSDMPNVELFVMSHCPYGTQMEKCILPVVKELKDDIDFEIKFVNYAMHPTQGEVEEQLNQYCIQKEQNDKYLDYLSCFLEDGDGEACLKELKIDTKKLKVCTDKTDEEFDVIKNLEDKASWSSGRFPKFMIHNADNQKYGVRGSPTLIINGQKAQSGRDAQSILNAICSAFTTKPDGCNTDMTSLGNPAPGFGFDTQGGSASAAGCGV